MLNVLQLALIGSPFDPLILQARLYACAITIILELSYDLYVHTIRARWKELKLKIKTTQPIAGHCEGKVAVFDCTKIM